MCALDELCSLGVLGVLDALGVPYNLGVLGVTCFEVTIGELDRRDSRFIFPRLISISIMSFYFDSKKDNSCKFRLGLRFLIALMSPVRFIVVLASFTRFIIATWAFSFLRILP